MCILLSTTEHPDFPFILLSNRDEYFRRPTQPAHFRQLDHNSKVLSPLDLGRPEHGTWIGVTTTGKIAVLVNYREDHPFSEVSRGILPLAYLCSSKPDDKWHKNLEASLSHVCKGKVSLNQIGGFSLVYGDLAIDAKTGKLDHLNILSNRGDHGHIHSTTAADLDSDLHGDISGRTTFGLSNSLYYEPWKKVKLGESMLHNLMKEAKQAEFSQEELVEECFRILSHDTYDKEVKKEKGFEGKLKELRNSIFIPPLETGVSPSPLVTTVGKFYGTRTQTIILLDRFGNLNYYERNLHSSDNLDDDASVTTSHFTFNIDQE
ncbi:NRDE protein-domain-containing protein [Scheffersomyces xylosifermentans]|uniref:NRDE protein-domain-containing protein n=1 Tax=Scheffersomyces xylosifermentans TaxID=1304137 RepID=UPI00315CC4E5